MRFASPMCTFTVNQNHKVWGSIYSMSPRCSMSMRALQLSKCKATLNSKWGNWVNFLSGGAMKGKIIISMIVYFY